MTRTVRYKAPKSEYRPEGDVFWDDDDPEQSHHDPHDIIFDTFSPGEIVKIQQAQTLPSFYGFIWPKNDGTDDDEEHYFLTLKDAEDKLAQLKSDRFTGNGGT